LVTPAQALDPGRTNSEYAWQRWGSEKGFPGNSISGFAQTPDGYLWIGTDKGLIRFDGLEFQVFEPAISGFTHMGEVQSLLTDADGNLWVLLQSTKILRYRDGKFEPGRDKAEFGITAMARQSNGSMLFLSIAYGALTYHDGVFETLTSLQDRLAKTPEGDTDHDDPSARSRWAPHFGVHSLAEPNSAVVAMAENLDGKIWLATQDSRLFQIADGKILAMAGRLSARITCLLFLKNGRLWIGTEHGIVVWNGTNTQAELPSVLRHNKILAMVQDRDSNIWVATSHELLRFTSNGVSLIAKQTLRISGPVTALFEDREGNLWVGGLRSISRLRDSVFVSYSIGRLESESSGPVYVDGEGRTWFAPFDGGLHWLKDGKQQSLTKDGLDRDVIYSIAGRKDELWIGRRRAGLTHLRYVNGAVITKTYTQAHGLAQNSVYAVYQSRSGSVWAATVNSGVSEYSKGRFTTYSKASGMTSDTVFSIEESQDGTIWFATPDGLNAFSKGKWRVFTIRDGLPSDNINCLTSDSSGILWIGTAAGLAFLRSGRIQKAYAPPLKEEILGIAADDIGNLWIATTNHISSVNRDRLLSNTVAESDLREYGLEDGLIGQQGVKRFRSVVRDPQGRIWFSTSRGLSVVDPSRAGREPPYVTVQIEGFSADGNSLNLQPPIQVLPDTHRMRFSYSGLSLSTPERIQFKYKLDGFDRDWSEPVSARAAVYTNVAWGTYTFRVMARNSTGAWNEQGAALNFTILPTWYQTNWFLAACVITGVLVVWTLFKLRMRQVARALSVRFDERLSERTRVARELHDTLLQTVQGSKMVADDALEQPSDPARMRRALEQLSVWLAQAAQEERAALNLLRTSTTSQNDLAEAFRRTTGDCRRRGSFEASFSLYGHLKEMHPVVRDEVYRIGYEAIRNACAHSYGSRVNVRLIYGQNLTLRVTDDGVGIDPTVLDQGKNGHYGLPGMRERAARIAGKLSITSSKDFGTDVKLVVPGRIIFRDRTATAFKRLTAIFSDKDETQNLD